MKSSLLHFVTVLFVCVAVFFGYGLWYTVIANKSASVANLQDQIDIKAETATHAALTRAAMAEISGDENTVQSYFVPKTSVVAFINYLETQGQAQKSTVNVLSVSTGTAGKQQVLILSLTIKGTFDAVMRTIGTIEYAPYDISISTLSLGKDDKNSWHANLGLIVGSVDSKVATSTP